MMPEAQFHLSMSCIEFLAPKDLQLLRFGSSVLGFPKKRTKTQFKIKLQNFQRKIVMAYGKNNIYHVTHNINRFRRPKFLKFGLYCTTGY